MHFIDLLEDKDLDNHQGDC